MSLFSMERGGGSAALTAKCAHDCDFELAHSLVTFNTVSSLQFLLYVLTTYTVSPPWNLKRHKNDSNEKLHLATSHLFPILCSARCSCVLHFAINLVSWGERGGCRLSMKLEWVEWKDSGRNRTGQLSIREPTASGWIRRKIFLRRNRQLFI